ncbi:MAG: response regulator transcription factor [Cyclobacteriaceae bacterium]|jgi:two-component system alkaline phosphatase synthesis response regulator PhoP|nr:response regulator transcription factor [Cyclobacteriaceae bacterium]
MGKSDVPKVLLVDDDHDILDLLQYNLEKEGYQVKAVDESKKVLKTAQSFHPDLIVMDLMMPHPNGIELCRELRRMKEFEDTYIFFLTAKSDNYYRQAAYETGADDYIEKIMGIRSLTHKITAVLKKDLVIRKRLSDLIQGDIQLRTRTLSAIVNGNAIALNKPEFELLFFLVQNEGKPVSGKQLLNYMWGSSVYLTESSVENYLYSVQQKIGMRLISQSTKGWRYSSASSSSNTSASTS